MIKVAVVILNWNGANDTLDCIESIKSNKSKSFEIATIIVDNASSDDSLEKLSKLKTITLLQNNENKGFAEGNNVGIRYAIKNKFDYICVLNNDTVIEADFFSKLIESYEKHPNVGFMSPKIYFAKGYEFHKNRYRKSDLGKVIWYAGGKMDWNNVYGSNANVDEVDENTFKSDSQTDFATGACLIAKREVFEKVGLFDKRYFLYLEDVDLSERAKKMGYEIWYASGPTMWHKVSQSSAIGSKLNDYYISRNRLLFGMSYAPIRARFALFRESIRFLISGREWQRQGVLDYYLNNLGKGSWKN